MHIKPAHTLHCCCTEQHAYTITGRKVCVRALLLVAATTSHAIEGSIPDKTWAQHTETRGNGSLPNQARPLLV